MAICNIVTELNFSGAHIGARFVSRPNDYHIENRSVVINPNRTNVVLESQRANVISPFSSVILRNVKIAAGDSIVALELRELKNLGAIVFERGWDLYANLVPADSPFPRDTPLWRSSQHEIGMIRFDPGNLPGQGDLRFDEVEFSMTVNLWFAPASTDCAIHNKHRFIEIHTQVSGYGRMQKFYAQDFSTLYHDETMSPGYTTATPFCNVLGPNEFVYPWHQYYADTDCIWMVVEYRPVAVRA